MRFRKRPWLLAAGLAMGLPLAALAGADGEVASDEIARVEKNLFHAPRRLAAADGIIDSGPSWGHCGPWIEDVDGDGRKDLIVGDFSGYFRYYRNEGSNKEPRYAKGMNLQAGGIDAQVPIY